MHYTALSTFKWRQNKYFPVQMMSVILTCWYKILNTHVAKNGNALGVILHSVHIWRSAIYSMST